MRGLLDLGVGRFDDPPIFLTFFLCLGIQGCNGK